MSERIAPVAGTRAAFDAGRPPRAATVVLLLMGFLAALAVITDMRVHRWVQEDRGVNFRGYRGPIARTKKVEDRRIIVLGGTLAFGPGLPRDETMPAYLERNLHQGWRAGNARLQATVVNLAAPGDGPASYLATLEDYASLGGDVVCILNDADTPHAGSTQPWRRQSGIYRLTKYFPLLPVVIADGLAAASVSAPPMPPVVSPGGREPATAADCTGEFKPYCDSLTATVQQLLADGRRVMVVVAPAATDRGRAREAAAAAMLHARYADRPDMRVVDTSTDPNLTPLRRLDAGRLTAHVTDRIAELITTPLLDLMR